MFSFIDSFFGATTTRRLFVNLGCLAFLIYAVPSAYLFYLNQEEQRRIEENYSHIVLKAIEGGALNFARMHAVSIANEQLDELLFSINDTGVFLLAVQIHSGPNLNEIVAQSNANSELTVPESCLKKYQSEKRFEDAVYPYLIQLSINTCEFKGQTLTQLIRLLLSGIVIVSGFIMLVIFAVRPVQKSLATLLRIAEDAQSQGEISLSHIPFLPLRRIATVFFETQSLRRDTAIARTTQMLAHDVRKPFNLFRMTLERVRTADNPAQMSAILNEALPEVDRSLASVNGLIADVLNVGGESPLTLKPMRLAPIMEEAIEEIIKLYPSHKLYVKCELPEDTWINADLTRLPRVFMNILSNAIEAIGNRNVHLWISVQQLGASGESGQDAVEIRMGNAGSFIAPESRERIFDLFFTSGKSGGTGLGLAIVKKIVSQHGGSVVCASERSEAYPEGKVEFIIRLNAAEPVAGGKAQPAAEDATLQAANVQISAETPEKCTGNPDKSTDYLQAKNFAQLGDSAGTEKSAQARDASTDTTPEAPKPNVVFLDDSPLARWVWEAKLKPHTNIRCFAGPRDFLESIESGGIELPGVHTIITDHYFAPDERLTGLDVARELRSQGYAGRILLASNGAFSPAELTGLVDKVVDKSPVKWEILNQA